MTRRFIDKAREALRKAKEKSESIASRAKVVETVFGGADLVPAKGRQVRFRDVNLCLRLWKKYWARRLWRSGNNAHGNLV